MSEKQLRRILADLPPPRQLHELISARPSEVHLLRQLIRLAEARAHGSKRSAPREVSRGR